MQEINLLQSKLKDTTLTWQRRSRLFTSLLAIVLVVLLGTTVVVSLLNNQTLKQFEALKKANAEAQTDLNQKQKDLTAAKSFQAQLHNLSYLANTHVYWSTFFDELGKFTFNKAQYVSVDANLDGKIHLEGNVANYSDLGKLMLGLKTSEKFDEVKLLSASPSSGEQAGYLFSIDLTINRDIFIKK